jgi:hypothetical protein
VGKGYSGGGAEVFGPTVSHYTGLLLVREAYITHKHIADGSRYTID